MHASASIPRSRSRLPPSSIHRSTFERSCRGFHREVPHRPHADIGRGRGHGRACALASRRLFQDELPAIFIADAPGLDFLNSIATPVDHPVEWVGSGEGLLNWLDRSGLVDAEVLDGFRRTALPGELGSIASQARTLREWFRDFVDHNRGVSLGIAALTELEPINRILARDEQFFQIAPQQKGPAVGAPVLVRQRRWRTPESLLIPLAQVTAELVCNEDFRDVKACEGHNCTLLFVDRTRGGRRRWCSMAVCGNRAKQVTHRERATKTQYSAI